MRSKSAVKILAAVILASAGIAACTGRSTGSNAVGANSGVTSGESDKTAEIPPEDPGEILFREYQKKILSFPLKGGDFPYNLKGLTDIRIVAALTGEYSINQTRTNYGIHGTDIGLVFDKGEELFFAFGDTFSGPNFSGSWRSNTLAVASDRDASDGIRFDRMIAGKTSKDAIEILHSRKQDNLEMTVIPTGGFSLGDTLYLCYMSVRHWGPPGRWDCNYGGIAKSVDNGQHWEKLTDLRWDGKGSFVQLCPVKLGDLVYFYGIGGGRAGMAALMRVPAARVEDKAAYEYLVDLDETGKPVYRQGEEAEKEPYRVIAPPAGELSVMYNNYLEEWLITYLAGEDLIIRSAKTPEGPFSAPHYIARQSDFPGLYGAFMHPAYTEEDGRILYFMMSIYEPVYNVMILKAQAVR